MEVVMKEIDVIAHFAKGGTINPIRFKYFDSKLDKEVVIAINKIITKSRDYFNGNLMHVFLCQSFINDIERRYEIKYEVKTNMWYLYKI